MKRAILAATFVIILASGSGCCAVKELFCSLPVARRLCCHGSAFCGPPIHCRSCYHGCGETYWGEAISDRVACHDPCDCCGNWCGPETEYPGYLPPGYGDYSAGPIMEGEGEVIYDGPIEGRPQGSMQPTPAPAAPGVPAVPSARRQGPARSAMQRHAVPEPIPDPRMSRNSRQINKAELAYRP